MCNHSAKWVLCLHIVDKEIWDFERKKWSRQDHVAANNIPELLWEPNPQVRSTRFFSPVPVLFKLSRYFLSVHVCMYVCVNAIKCLAAEPSFTQKMQSMKPMYVKQIKEEIFWSKYSVIIPFLLATCTCACVCCPLPYGPPPQLQPEPEHSVDLLRTYSKRWKVTRLGPSLLGLCFSHSTDIWLLFCLNTSDFQGIP